MSKKKIIAFVVVLFLVVIVLIVAISFFSVKENRLRYQEDWTLSWAKIMDDPERCSSLPDYFHLEPKDGQGKGTYFRRFLRAECLHKYAIAKADVSACEMIDPDLQISEIRKKWCFS